MKKGSIKCYISGHCKRRPFVVIPSNSKDKNEIIKEIKEAISFISERLVVLESLNK